MRRVVFCIACTACAPAAPPMPQPPAPPAATTGSPSAPRPASVSVDWTRRPSGVFDWMGTVVARDKEGQEIFRGDLRMNDVRLSLESTEPGRSFHLPLRRFPNARGEASRKLAVGPSGVLLVGASDGSLVAVDISGAPLFELGVRGAVSTIEARPEGGFAVTTAAGEVIVDPALPAPREPPASIPAPIRYLVEPPPGGRAPDVVVSANDAWALGSSEEGVKVVYRFDGKTWKRVQVAALGLKSHPGMGRPKSDFTADRLERGPKGQPLLLGTRLAWYPGNMAVSRYSLGVFEWTGSAFQERLDLMPANDRTIVEAALSDVDPITYAAGPGGREIVCLDVHCLARGLPSSFRLEGEEPPVKTKAHGWVYFPWSSRQYGNGQRATAFAGDALYRFVSSGVTRNGAKLVDGDTVLQAIARGNYPLLPDPHGPAHDTDTGRSDRLVRGIWARRADDVWISVGYRGGVSALFRWNGKELVSVPRPMPWVDDIWGTGPDDVWLTGDSVAHYDGHEFHRIPGIPPGAIVAGASGDVWIGGWHVVRAPAATPDLVGAPAATPPFAPPSAELSVRAAPPGLVTERVTLKVPGEAPMTAALGVEVGPSGVVWLHDRSRLVELDGLDVRGLHRASGAALLDCQRCVAPRRPGEGVFLSQGPDRMVGLREIGKGGVTNVLWSPDMLAVANAPNGDVWGVSAAEDHGVARAFVRTPDGIRNVTGLPVAAYSNLAIRTAEDVWFSGGLVAFHDGTRTQPAGEGILVHFDGHAFKRYRGPDGALLSVAAVGPGEAWAVGLDGGLVHVKGEVATAYHLEQEGARQRVALRAVAATGPDDVWISGDGSTLLRWDGKDFTRMDLPGVGVDAALTAVVPPRGEARGWLAGPRGLWRMRLADKAPGRGQ